MEKLWFGPQSVCLSSPCAFHWPGYFSPLCLFDHPSTPCKICVNEGKCVCARRGFIDSPLSKPRHQALWTRCKEVDITPTLTCWHTKIRKTDGHAQGSFVEGSRLQFVSSWTAVSVLHHQGVVECQGWPRARIGPPTGLLGPVSYVGGGTENGPSLSTKDAQVTLSPKDLHVCVLLWLKRKKVLLWCFHHLCCTLMCQLSFPVK